jgi:regulator of protease activity HflC (stomatin/prohibitin superfamily)
MLAVDAVVFYRVIDSIKAIVNVKDYLYAVSQISQTSLRSTIGKTTLQDLLQDRDQVSAELQQIIDGPTEGRGASRSSGSRSRTSRSPAADRRRGLGGEELDARLADPGRAAAVLRTDAEVRRRIIPLHGKVKSSLHVQKR